MTYQMLEESHREIERLKAELAESEQSYREIVTMCEQLRGELESARRAVFMPSAYQGSLADYLAVEVWPMPRSEDIEKIQELKGEVDNLAMLVKRLIRHFPDDADAKLAVK